VVARYADIRNGERERAIGQTYLIAEQVRAQGADLCAGRNALAVFLPRLVGFLSRHETARCKKQRCNKTGFHPLILPCDPEYEGTFPMYGDLARRRPRSDSRTESRPAQIRQEAAGRTNPAAPPSSRRSRCVLACEAESENDHSLCDTLS